MNFTSDHNDSIVWFPKTTGFTTYILLCIL